MARLQGHFAQYRESATDAIDHAYELKQPTGDVDNVRSGDSDHIEGLKRDLAVRRAKRGPLTASDVDRMVFNPQPGWDDNIK